VAKFHFTHFPLTVMKMTKSYDYMFRETLVLIYAFVIESWLRNIFCGWKIFTSVRYSHFISFQNRSVTALFKTIVQKDRSQIQSS